MKQIFLISTQDLKNYSIINDNVDDSLLHNAILESQEIELQELLGTKLYKKILQLIDNDQIALSQNSYYKTLLDEYCTKIVLYAALHRAIPYVHYKVVNKGITTQSSEYSTTTSIQEMEFLMDKIKNDLEFFSNRMTKYLLANIRFYPEYMSATSIDDMIPNVQPYRTSMVIGSSESPCVRIMGYNWRTVNVPY